MRARGLQRVSAWGDRALLRRGGGRLCAWDVRAANSGTSISRPFHLVFRSCVGRLAAQRSWALVGLACAGIRAVHVDATEGGMSFDISLAVEVRADSPGKEVPEPTRG